MLLKNRYYYFFNIILINFCFNYNFWIIGRGVMTKKIRSIYIEDEIWELLPQYINCSVSAFFEECARKQINLNDDIVSIDIDLKKVEHEIANLKLNKQKLLERKEYIANKRIENKTNMELISKAMTTIRNVISNEGAITESRVKFIANNYVLNSNILLKQCEVEELKVIRGK